jgi:hypothetical protein
MRHTPAWAQKVAPHLEMHRSGHRGACSSTSGPLHHHLVYFTTVDVAACQNGLHGIGFMTADWHLTQGWHETQGAAASSAAGSPDSDGTLLCTVRDLSAAAADALADALLEHGALSAA